MARRKTVKKKTSSWRKVIQEKKREQFRLFLKWGFLFLAIFIAVNFLVEVFRTVKFSSWGGKHQVSLVIVHPESVWLVALKPKLSEAVLTEIPNETIVSAALGFGEYKIGSLAELAEIESISRDQMVIETVRQNFGLPAVGFLRLKKPERDLIMIFFNAFIGRAKTNLTKLELIRALWFVKGLRFDQIEVLDLKETTAIALREEPDGSKLYELQEEQLDIFMNRYFSDIELVQEETTWEILNATNHSGLAELVGRLLKNSGSMVVGLRTGDFGEGGGLYKSKRFKGSSFGIKFWAKILSLPIRENLAEDAKSDLVIVLGEDFWKRCCSRQ